ncbi:MAG TPA: glycerate kinase [Mycobacteriales bacterium]|nr:glycerate kinase [Mycobacteriales bacterium]
MRVVVAPDSFAGTLTAIDAAAAMAAGWQAARPGDTLVEVPVADGGEGTVHVVAAASGSTTRSARVAGPLGAPVDADWLLLADGTAVIEMAAASGLALVAPDDRDPRRTTTRGTGELVRAALDAGARRVVVGLGGSATNDGGAGLAQALGARLLDGAGAELAPGGAALAGLARIDLTGLDPRLAEVDVVAATDVDNVLCGPDGASAVYGPQKGAGPGAVAELDAALRRWADVLGAAVPAARGVAEEPGAGAAGGLGAALLALCGARRESGAAVVLGLIGFRRRLARADLVVTGEGCLDPQSLRGKAPVAVADAARAVGLPCVAVAGRVEAGRRELAAAGIDAAYAVVDIAPSYDDAVGDAAVWVAELAARVAREWSR